MARPGKADATAHGSRLERSRVKAAWLFLSPMLTILLAVAGWPLLRTFWFSLTDANLSDMTHAQFIGLENFLASDDGEWFGLLVDGQWWNAVGNTLYFAVVSVAIETVLGVAIALVLNRAFAGNGLLRAAVLIPWAIPTIVSAKMWGWMMHDQFGILNHLLLGLGLISEPIAWTADPHMVMTSVILVDVWKTTPFVALLILAALKFLPTDCYEAAYLDGVHPVRVFLSVTLPLLKPALTVAVVFRLLDALRMFDLVYVLTPNSEESATMSVFARQQLVDFQQVGYGSAAATAMFFIIALLIASYITLAKVRLRER